MSNSVAAPGAALMHDAIRLGETLGLSNREARGEAELLLMRALGVTRAQLIADPGLAAQAAHHQGYRAMVQRRLAGEPVAYILGEREFYGEVFSVSPQVLIPRPETELLVDLALERLDAARPAQVLDLGTGSGAIAIAIALQRPHVSVTAVDACTACLDLAAANAKRLLRAHQRIRWLRSDWFEAVAGAQFDLIVSNPPYVAEGDEHLGRGDVRFEPRRALVSGPSGLDALRQIIGAAAAYLVPGGWLLCEHGYDQAAAVEAMLNQAGLREVFRERDLAGVVRVSGGCWLTASAGGG
jgi:release factor glutamine methyltransferase